MKQIFVLTYNYTNKKLAQMAIACVVRCRSTHGKQLRVRDIIEMDYTSSYLVEISAEWAEPSASCTIRECCRI